MPDKLNIGCGYDIRPGYLNVDLHERHGPDLVADITDLNMLPSDYFSEIVAQDVLEHLERQKTVPALQEWSRLLKDNGVIEIRVPSLLGMFEFLAAPEWRPIERTEEAIHLMYGTQAYTGDYHLAGFTAEVLAEYLRRASLALCKAEILGSWLFVVHARKTDALTDPVEIAHNAYFRVLGRPADASGLENLANAIRQGESIEGAENLLRQSDEFKFREKNPTYLVPYMNEIESEIVKPRFLDRVASALRRRLK
jgi:predicted SAM-dependent methyltransferase